MGSIIALRKDDPKKPVSILDEPGEELPEADPSWANLIDGTGSIDLPPPLHATREERFAWLVDHALSAMLDKRYAVAYQALLEADALVPGDRTVAANLERLRALSK